VARKPQTLGSFAADLVTALGGKPTKQSEKLFQSWQRWEGGWSHNAATYNPLNLTAPGSGLPTINSVGVVALPSYQAGISRTAKLLQSGYPTIARALASGQYDFSDPGLQADFNRWLTGKRTPGMSKYVSKIAGSLGVPLPPGGGRVPTPGAPAMSPMAKPQQPIFNEEAMSRSILSQFLTGGGRVDFASLPSLVEQSWTMPPPPKEDLSAPPSGPEAATPTQPLKPGKGIITSRGWKETAHAGGHTGGLPQFTQPADIMGAPGTAIYAPSGGVITKIGTAQEGGQSYYIRGDDGYEYWLGHIDARLPVGSRIKSNQLIATVSGAHPRPHLHIDRRKM
jgi:hypothetical protein